MAVRSVEVVPGEFDFIRTLYTVCASFSFVMGTVLNGFLLWLILTKTPAPMLNYSKLLMAPCLMDLFFAMFTFLVQPIIVVDHGYFGVIQNGFFRKMSNFWNYSANVLWFQILLLFVCCMTIQFIFRYSMINSFLSDGQIPKRVKWLTAVVVIVLLCAHVMLHYFSDYPYEHYRPEMAELALKIRAEVGITDIRFSSFTPAVNSTLLGKTNIRFKRSTIWILHCLAMLGIFAICYGIIMFCALGTCQYIAKACALSAGDGTTKVNMADMRKHERMREYNKQITSALIIQSILPTVDVLELGIQTCFPIIFHKAAPFSIMVYATVPLYFFPVLNPLGTMLFVKPYRIALLKLVGLEPINNKLRNTTSALHTLRSSQRSSIKSNSPVHNNNNNNNNTTATHRFTVSVEETEVPQSMHLPNAGHKLVAQRKIQKHVMMSRAYSVE